MRAIVLSAVLGMGLVACGPNDGAKKRVDAPFSSPIISYPDFTIFYPNTEGVTIGNGWNSQLASKSSDICVASYKEVRDPGATRRLNFERVTDAYSLLKSISASAEAKAPAIFGGQASAAASYAFSQKLNASSVYVSAFAEVLNGATYLAPIDANSNGIRLTDAAEELLKTDPANFKLACGDGFVSSVITGGNIHAMYEFQTNSLDEKLEVSAAFSGSFPSFSVDATTKAITEKYSQSSRMRLNFIEISSPGGALPLSQVELESRIANLPIAVATESSPYKLVVRSYASLPQLGERAIVLNPFVENAIKEYLRLDQLLTDVLDVESAPQNYIFEDPVTLETVKVVRDEIDAARRVYAEAIDACLKRDECSFGEQTPKIDYDYRVLLPPPRSYNPDEVRIVELNKSLEEATARETEAKGREKRWPGDIEDFGKAAKRWHEWNGKKKDDIGRARADIQKISGEIETLRGLPSKTKEIQFRFWLAEPAAQRCRSGEDAICLSNARMSDYKSQLIDGGQNP